MKFLAWLAASTMLAGGIAIAQTVQQSGNVTAGHPAGWVFNNVLGDAGPAINGTLTGVGVTASSLTGMCQNTHPISQPYVELCTGVTDSSAVISLQGYGENTPLWYFLYNGISYPIPPVGGQNTVINWLNVATPPYSAVSDENDSASCTWSSTQLTCPNKNFSLADVGKTIAIDYAGVSFQAYVSTFSSFVSTHVMGLASAPTTTINPGTALIHVTQLGVPANGGVGYLVGDTIALSCGAGCTQVSGAGAQATGIISEIGFGTALPTIANGGTGGLGGNSGNCTVIGTTGYALSGAFIQVNVTLTSGVITSVTGYLNGAASNYTTNMTTPSAEPVAAGTCIGLTGAVLNFAPSGVPVFDAENVQARDTTTGFYSAITCSSTVAYGTTTSGAGSGMTLNCNTLQAAARWGTDNTAAFTAAMNAANVQSGIPNPYRVYVPAGKYFTKPVNVSVKGFGCLEGDAQFHSNIFLIPNTGGDFFSTLDSNNNGAGQSLGGTNTFSTDTGTGFGPEQAGSCVRHITIMGMRSTSAVQNGVMFYGGTDWSHIEDYQAYYIRGRALGVGADNTLVNGGKGAIRESALWDLRFENDGDAGIPTVDLVSMGHIYGINGIHIWLMRIFQSHGPSMAIRSCSDSDPAHLISLDASHFEQSGVAGTSTAGDNLQLGDTNCTSESFPISPNVGGGSFTPTNSTSPGINGVQSEGTTYSNAIAGYANLHILGTSANNNFIMSGNIGAAGGAAGGGVWVDGGQKSIFRFSSNAANDYQFRAGTSPSSTNVGPGLTYDCLYSGCSVTTFVENDALPAGANPISFPAYNITTGHLPGTLFVQTANVTNSVTTGGDHTAIGSGNGTLSLGRNYAQIGTTVRFTAGGTIIGGATPGTLTFRLKMGGVVIATCAASITANATNPWQFTDDIMFPTIGTAATIQPVGYVSYTNTTPALAHCDLGNAGALATGFDTTGIISTGLNFTTQWSLSGNSVTTTNFTVQTLN